MGDEKQSVAIRGVEVCCSMKIKVVVVAVVMIYRAGTRSMTLLDDSVEVQLPELCSLNNIGFADELCFPHVVRCHIHLPGLEPRKWRSVSTPGALLLPDVAILKPKASQNGSVFGLEVVFGNGLILKTFSLL